MRARTRIFAVQLIKSLWGQPLQIIEDVRVHAGWLLWVGCLHDSPPLYLPSGFCFEGDF